MRIRLTVIVAVVAAIAGCGSAMPGTASPIQNASFIVQPPMAAYFKELDEREQREQVRDWAVIGTVAHLGATPEQAAAATYELPPARLPYLENLYSFEYGHGRRAYLGKRVLLFRDSDDRSRGRRDGEGTAERCSPDGAGEESSPRTRGSRAPTRVTCRCMSACPAEHCSAAARDRSGCGLVAASAMGHGACSLLSADS